jgi:hypothetical protein
MIAGCWWWWCRATTHCFSRPPALRFRSQPEPGAPRRPALAGLNSSAGSVNGENVPTPLLRETHAAITRRFRCGSAASCAPPCRPLAAAHGTSTSAPMDGAAPAKISFFYALITPKTATARLLGLGSAPSTQPR